MAKNPKAKNLSFSVMSDTHHYCRQGVKVCFVLAFFWIMGKRIPKSKGKNSIN